MCSDGNFEILEKEYCTQTTYESGKNGITKSGLKEEKTPKSNPHHKDKKNHQKWIERLTSNSISSNMSTIVESPKVD